MGSLSINENDILLIESYLKGELTVKEIEQFELRLDSDDLFRKQFEEMKIIFFGVRKSVLSEKLKLLEDIDKSQEIENNDNRNFQKIRRLNLVRIMSIAASVVLIGVTAMLLQDKDIPKSEKEFAKVNVIPVSNVITKSSNTEHSGLKQNAYLAYDHGEYGDAVKLLEDLFEEEADTMSLFFAGVAALNDKQLELSEQYLMICRSYDKIDEKLWKTQYALLTLRKGDIETYKKMMDQLNE